MRVLFLTKRVYTNKDLVRDRYGRVYEFSHQLSSMGHQVYGLALDYRRNLPDASIEGTEAQGPLWFSCNLFPNPIGGIRRYVAEAIRLIEEFSPDVLVSVSDVYHVIIGDWLASRLGITHVADLYDNYECFGAARVPGVVTLFRKALARADGIVCVSNQLKKHVIVACSPNCTPEVIHNAVNKDLFRPLDKAECRRHFGLPDNRTLVGFGGSLAENRGIRTVFAAHRALLESGSDMLLVLAGARARDVGISVSDNIRYLGKLDYAEMPLFFGALDVGIVNNRKSSFSRYCFPQKFFEMQACNLPVVVALIGDVKDAMADCPNALFMPGEVSGLMIAIRKQLAEPCHPAVEIPTWDLQGIQLSSYLQEVASS